VRVVAKEAFRFFYNHVPVDVAKGDVIDSDAAVYLLNAGALVRPDDEDAESLAAGLAAPLGDSADPPGPPAELDITASAGDVLAWVGDDPERAAEALAAETAKDKPRSTLVKQLEKIAPAEPVAPPAPTVGD
jgi:hypothetical protein